MGTRAVVETGQDRKALIADAGFSRLSFGSVAAGVFSAYGAFAVLAGLVAGVLKAADANVDVTANWRNLGIGGGLVVAGLLLVAYLFGGYVAGRMARRAGTLHGAVVFVLGLVVVAAAAVVTRALGGADAAASNLRDLGVPTTGAEWADVASVAGIASLVAMLVGSLAGGALGERWHTKLLARALDPNVGAEAEARATAERLAAEAEERRTESVQRVRATAPTRTARVDREVDEPDVNVDGYEDGTDGAEADEVDFRERAYAAHPAGRRSTNRMRETNGHTNGDLDTPDGNGSFWWRIPEPAGSRRSDATDRS